MKKILSVLLMLSMLFSLCVFGASASNISAVEPTEVTLHTTDGQIIISWRNPVWTADNALTAINLYDGEGNVITSEFVLESGKIQSYTHASLTTGNVYDYKLEFTYADGSVIPVKLSSKAVKSELQLYVGTSANNGVISYSRETEKQALSVIMDNSEQRNGHPTLKITNHKGVAYKSGLLTVSVGGLKAAGTYTFSYYQKASAADIDAGRTHVVSFENGTVNGGTAKECTFKLGTGDWYKRTVTYTQNSDTDKFVVNFITKSVENFWLDELSLVETGTTTNLLANSSNDKICGYVAKYNDKNNGLSESAITSTSQKNSIITNWNWASTATRISSLKFYIKETGASAYTYAGEVAGQYGSSGNFVFENLSHGTSYDVKVTRISCGVEVDLKNETITTPAIDMNVYEPTEVTLHTAATQNIISWRNPAYADNNVTGISLYAENGTLLSESFGLVAGAANQYKHTGLTTGNTYGYKLEFTYADGSKRSVKLSTVTATPPSPTYFGTGNATFRARYTTDVMNYAMSAEINDNELRDGKHVIKLTSHTGATNTVKFMKIECQDLDTTATYTFSFDAKVIGSNYGIVQLYSKDTHLTDYQTYFTTKNEWVSKSIQFTPSDKLFYAYFLVNTSDGLYVDNLSLVKDSDEAKTNLLAAAIPETIYSKVKAFSTITASEVSNAAASKSITTTWNTTKDKFNSLKFYIKKTIDSEYSYKGEVASQKKGSFVFEELLPETSYDVRVTRITNGVEVDLKNETITTAALDMAVYKPFDIMTTPGDKEAVISWKNPEYEDNALTSIAVYDSSGAVLKNDFSLEAGAAQVFSQKELANGSSYEYKAEFTYSDGTTLSYKFSVVPTDSTAVKYMGVDYEGLAVMSCYATDSMVNAGYNKSSRLPINLFVDEAVYSAGSTASVKIVNNTGVKKDVRCAYIPGMFTKGEEYTITFDIKGDAKHDLKLLFGGYDSYWQIKNNDTWQTVTKTFTATEAWLHFITMGTGTIWIDNVKIVKSGETTDLLDSIDAENFIYAASDKADLKSEDVTVTAREKTADIYWDEACNAASLKFYAKKSSEAEYTFLGEYAGATGKFTVDGLETGTTYNVLVTQVYNGTELELLETNVTPVVPVWSVSEYSFKLGDTEAEEVTTEGTYTASVTVYNNTSQQEVKAQLIAAIYSGDTFVNVVWSDQASIRRGKNASLSTHVSVTDASYNVKLFVWDSVAGMKPLAKASKLY